MKCKLMEQFKTQKPFSNCNKREIWVRKNKESTLKYLKVLLILLKNISIISPACIGNFAL